MTMNLHEACREDEIQALIALIELSEPVETPNNNFYTFHPTTLQAARAYFRCFALDLNAAFESLAQKGLLCRERDLCLLSPQGRETAKALRHARPPIWYWYKEFYIATENSKAFSIYCQRTFGKDLAQHGFSDMQQIHQMLNLIRPDAGKHLLDIGCGNGKIAEYISDHTGAKVTGIDYIPETIDQARRRTVKKKKRMQFEVCDINNLDQISGTFDAILAIDSIFFGENLENTIRRLQGCLSQSGNLEIFCEEDLCDLLKKMNLKYECFDLSQAHYEHLQHKHRTAKALQAEFEAEGNRFIWENLMTESVASDAPFDAHNPPVRRYLYHIRNAMQ